ncbi:MAG: hypothetical protein ACLFTK_09565, partial [Anaerolineales bacterium]
DAGCAPVSDAGSASASSLAATTQALDISFFHYLRDRLMNQEGIPPLTEIIRLRAASLNLSASWQGAATSY